MSTSRTDSPVAGAAPAVGETPPASARASILLVDDQPARLLSYEAVLYGLGVHCVRATSGAQALERLLEQEFAAILLDVNMPEMDGFEVARLVREHPRMERTPIIFVTAVNVSELDRLKGYELGAIDYIAVPVVPEILRSKVAVLVELHQRRAQLLAVNADLKAARDKLDAEHEKALRASEQRYGVLIHNAPVAVAHNSLDGRFEYVNKAFCDLVGYNSAELLARTWQDITHPDDVARDMAAAGRVRAGEKSYYTIEKRYIRRDGGIVWVNLFGNIVFDDQGNAVQGLAIVIDITERRQNDRRKDEFLAMLAHELRNPVAPIANAAELLSRLVPQANQQTLVGIIQRQAVHLARLLDDLLDVARITQGRIELKREVLDIGACVQLAIETAEPLIRSKAHRLTVTQTLEPIYVFGDKVRLGQCIAHVLINAAKYTGDGGDIFIRPYIEGGQAVIEIADNGIGMPAEFLPRIFDLFAQSGRGLDRSQGGLGVGLTVCKQIVEMHGGTVVASSPGVDRGSTFTLRVPLAERPAIATPAAAPQPDSLKRVMIVDDNRDAADSLAMLLQFEGRKTLCAYSGEEALEQFVAFRPQLVLLDIGLPGVDGYEVARRLKAADPAMRVVALSGYGQVEDRQRSVAAGFDAHLVKPIDLDALKRVLATAAPG
jgi:PAS domain S-box-containing protein